jgi:ABC-2 type transport system permease protein
MLANPRALPDPEPPDRLIPMQPYASEDQARMALNDNDIQAYFVLPNDYPENSSVKLVYEQDQPGSSVTSQFRDFLRINLLADQPPEVTTRILAGADLQIVTLGGESEGNDFTILLKLLVPAFTGIALMVAVFTSSGYLMQAVVDEKENRTMEIMITSVSPSKMMAGKVIGLICVGLTQILAWILMGVVGLAFVVDNFEGISLGSLDLGNIWLALAVILPAFVMISALMAAIGATVTEAREGNQVTGMLPFFFFGTLISNPDGIVAVALSLFPLTAPITLIMRSGFTTIPTWQLVVSLALLVISALGALWLAGQVFRLGMLRYGQRVRLGEIFDVIKPSRPTASES